MNSRPCSDRTIRASVGLVLTTGTGEPVVETPVEIWQGTKRVATVRTDADVLCMWAYKCTGKAATFMVRLTAYNMATPVTLKSNGYLVVNFITP